MSYTNIPMSDFSCNTYTPKSYTTNSSYNPFGDPSINSNRYSSPQMEQTHKEVNDE